MYETTLGSPFVYAYDSGVIVEWPGEALVPTEIFSRGSEGKCIIPPGITKLQIPLLK